MKKILAMALAVAFTVGCGTSGTSYSELKNKMDHPTGTLSKDNSKSVALALAKAQKNQPPAVSVGTQGALTSGLTNNGNDDPIKCEDPGTSSYSGGAVHINCTCEEGGTVVYSVDTGSYQSGGSCTTVYKYSDCKIDNEVSDGTGYVYMADCGNYKGGVCYKFDGTVGGEALNMEACVDQNNKMWFLIDVDGQGYAVSGDYDPETGDGEWYVKDQGGEWHCTASSGHGSCKGPGGSFEF